MEVPIGGNGIAKRIKALEFGVDLNILRAGKRCDKEQEEREMSESPQSPVYHKQETAGMQFTPFSGSTQTMTAIAAAVTPVVMISANAILVSAVSSKHQAMADRVRMLTAEWRAVDTTDERREAIRKQVELFRTRVALVARAHFLLFAAIACFIAMVLTLALTPFTGGRIAIDLLSLPLLVAGVVLMLAAILIELMELRRARLTMDIETAGISAHAGRSTTEL
jgi:hypothetical protein